MLTLTLTLTLARMQLFPLVPSAATAVVKLSLAGAISDFDSVAINRVRRCVRGS